VTGVPMALSHFKLMQKFCFW